MNSCKSQKNLDFASKMCTALLDFKPVCQKYCPKEDREILVLVREDYLFGGRLARYRKPLSVTVM